MEWIEVSVRRDVRPAPLEDQRSRVWRPPIQVSVELRQATARRSSVVPLSRGLHRVPFQRRRVPASPTAQASAGLRTKTAVRLALVALGETENAPLVKCQIVPASPTAT